MNCLNIDMLLSRITATLTHEKTGALHTLTGELPSVELYAVRFKAVQPYKKGDTFQLGEDAYIAQNIDGTVLEDDAFVTDALVSIEVDAVAKKVNFQCHTATAVPPVDPPIDPPTDEKICLPASWIDRRTGQAKETISKYDAVTLYENTDTNKATLITLPNPEVLPANTPYNCCFSAKNNYFAVAHHTSPYISIYKHEGDVFTKLANPNILPTGNAFRCTFSDDATYLAVSHDVAPRLTIYKRDGDTFTKISNPSTLPTEIPNVCEFSPDNNYLVITGNISLTPTAPPIIYKRVGDIFKRITQFNVFPSNASGCSFSPDGKHLAFAHDGAPYVSIFQLENDTFTAVQGLSLGMPGNGRICKFSANGDYLAITHAQDPYISIYKKDGNQFAKLQNHGIVSNAGFGEFAFSHDSNYFVVREGPTIALYRRYGDNFINLLTSENNTVINGVSCAFSADSRILALPINLSPYLKLYRFEENAPEIVQKLSTASLEAIKQEGGTCLGIGVALQDASQGEQCEVNLFPPINNELERFANISFEPDTNQA